MGYGIAMDGSGSAYVTGQTDSTDFPTQNPFQTVQGSSNAFVTKLSPSGNSLVYSTYLGGNFDDAGNSIAVDGSGAHTSLARLGRRTSRRRTPSRWTNPTRMLL